MKRKSLEIPALIRRNVVEITNALTDAFIQKERAFRWDKRVICRQALRFKSLNKGAVKAGLVRIGVAVMPGASEHLDPDVALA